MSAAARHPLLFEAFAHPVRAQILARLVERPSSPTQMASELDTSIGVVSYHARRLAELGLARIVARERAERRRGPPQNYYSAGPIHVPDEDWISVPAAIRLALADAALRELASRPLAGYALAVFAADPAWAANPAARPAAPGSSQ